MSATCPSGTCGPSLLPTSNRLIVVGSSRKSRAAHLHGIALPALHRGRDLLAAERQADHFLRVAGGEPVAGEGIRVRPDVQVAPSKRPLGVDARRARKRRERALDVLANP